MAAPFDINGNINVNPVQNTADSIPASDLKSTADVIAIQSAKSTATIDGLSKQQMENQNIPSEKDRSINKVVSNISDYVQSVRRELQFTVDKESGSTVIKVYNQSTGDLVRQIPSEEFLKLAKMIKEYQSTLLDEIV